VADAAPARPILARVAAARAALTPGEWRITLLLGATFAAAGYDTGLLGLALPQIQAGLGIAEDQVGGYLAVVRIGILPAFALALFADRIGRRRILIGSVLGFTACHAASALAQTPAQFVALQVAARTFALAEEMVAIVALAEHLSARSRGLGLGVLAALEDVGHGAAALAFGFLGDADQGWRALYLVGALPLALVAWLRRSLPETARFEAERARRASQDGVTSALAPLREALRRYPGRLAAVVAAAAPFAFVAGTSLTFVSKTLQEVHGYAPHQVSALYIGAGVLLLPASLLAGALADRFGRRRLLVALLLANAAGSALFYNVSGALVAGAWVLMMLGWAGCEVLFSAVSAELFPTSYRSTASGLRAIAIALGAALGLWVQSQLYGPAGSHAAAITWMLAVLVIPIGVVLAALPETAARELEAISPETEPRM
jgi:MFS family permease